MEARTRVKAGVITHQISNINEVNTQKVDDVTASFFKNIGSSD